MTAEFHLPRLTLETRRFFGVYLLAMQLPCGKVAVKIGKSKNPRVRLASFQTGLPFEFLMKWTPIGCEAWATRMEAILHSAFKDNHTRGEWFLFDAKNGKEMNKKVNSLISEKTGRDVSWEEIIVDAGYQSPRASLMG